MGDGLKIDSGRWFTPGRREVVVGKNIAYRYSGAQIGNKLQFGKGDWEIVGIMSQGSSAVNSELFVDLNQAASDYNRSEVLSSILIRAVDRAAVQSLVNELKADQRLNVDAITEQQYYENQMISAAPIRFLGTFVAIIMAVGSCFAAMNTMYACGATRARSGHAACARLFPRWHSVQLLPGIAVAFGDRRFDRLHPGLPLNNITTGLGNFVTFSETSFSFRVTPAIMATGVLFAIFLGAIGGILPARMAARKEILNALREI